MSETYDAIGVHAVLNGQFYDGDQKVPNFDLLNNIERLDSIISKHLVDAGATILSAQKHQFDPQGVTLTYALSESHASIHTYPEHGSFFLDIFTCGLAIEPGKAAILIAEELGCSYDEHTYIRKPN